MERKPKNRGFTLIELMVAVIIVSIMLVIGVPAFQTFIQNNRQTSQLNTMVMTLLSARSEAVRWNVPVVICTSDNGTQCRDCGTDTDCHKWEEGWIAFTDVEPPGGDGDVDDNGTGDACEDTEDCILSVADALPGNTTVRFDDGGNGDAVAYQPAGGTDVTGTFTVCVVHASKLKEVEITSTGRPMTKEKDPSGGKPTQETCPPP